MNIIVECICASTLTLDAGDCRDGNSNVISYGHDTLCMIATQSECAADVQGLAEGHI